MTQAMLQGYLAHKKHPLLGPYSWTTPRILCTPLLGPYSRTAPGLLWWS